MNTSQVGVNLIKSFEGFRAKAYKLDGEKYFTIGYGHSYDNAINANTVWTEAQGEVQLKKDLSRFEDYVEQGAKKYGFKFNQYQFDALVSYCYNRGAGGLDELLRNSNSKNIADNIVKYWGSAERYKTGLVRRREAERVLFLKHVEAPPKPKPVVKIHVVKKGDTLSKIGLKYGVTLARLKADNRIKNENLIYPGQKIKVVK